MRDGMGRVSLFAKSCQKLHARATPEVISPKHMHTFLNFDAIMWPKMFMLLPKPYKKEQQMVYFFNK